jgi:indolepyruvate ferredoxin oxidoreductase beta subunit
MKYDIVLAGVGGQGVLSLSGIIALSALDEGYYAKQSEVHGMAQRGGAVSANLRLSDMRIASGLVPRGSASLILSMEPLESLRYLEYLAPGGSIIASSDPIINIPNYPPLSELFEKILSYPGAVLVDGARLAKKAGAPRASNMVMAGAASHVLPISVETMERFIGNVFRKKGDNVVETNIKAFRAGRRAYAAESGLPAGG